MAIKGLTDQGRRFPRIGQLRKGSEKVGNKPGRDLEHFRFVSAGDAAVGEAFEKAYGAAPKAVNVYLPYHTVEENFPTWKEHWVAGGLRHRCDGETCVLWLDEKTGKYRQDPVPCPGECSEVGKLICIIPELQRFAYVEVPTTSIWDIIGLTENLEAYQALGNTLQGIPFILSRKPREISTPSGQGGQRARRVKWLLHIEPHPEWARMQLSVLHQRALALPSTGALALPGGRIVDHDTGEVYTSLDDGELEEEVDFYEPDPADVSLKEAEKDGIQWAMGQGLSAEVALDLWEKSVVGIPSPVTDEDLKIAKQSFVRKVYAVTGAVPA